MPEFNLPEFNLVDREWIPCLMRTGNQPRELSLRDVLIEAHNIREVFDDSPLVTVALHRLLLAILHRNFGPTSFNEWKELWRRGKWDGEVIEKYLAQWRYRFDLFDEERPFYQVKRMANAGMQPAALLALEIAGSQATLFDHSFDDSPAAMPAAMAARYVIARQAFSIGFGKSDPFYLQDSTLVRGFSCLAVGNSLFETLALNMLVYTPARPVEWQGEDSPVWEQEAPATPDKQGTLARGYLDYLTWQSRRIHLIPDGHTLVVSQCQVQQNLVLADEPRLLDPFKCYQEVKEKGLQPKGVNPTKALWRDSHTLFQQVDQTKRRPEIFNFVARVETARRYGEIEAHPAYSLSVYGFATEIGKAASVVLWSRERLPLPLTYLTEPYLVESLRLALSLANDVRDHLNDSIRLLAKLLIAPLSSDKSARQPDANDVSNLVSGFAAEQFYWARLEPAFKKLLTDLPEDQRANQAAEDLPDTRAATEWARVLLETARAALDKTINSLSSSARELKAAAEAERRFNGLMKQVREAHPRLFPPKPGGNS